MGLKINFFKNNNKNYKLEHNLFNPHSVDANYLKMTEAEANLLSKKND